jgi:acetyltransferase
MALVAVIQHEGRELQIAVARYVINPDWTSCEFAIVVRQDWQGHGLGRHLMLRLIDIAKARGLASMTGQILSANVRMLGLAKALGFLIQEDPDDRSVKHVRLALK